MESLKKRIRSHRGLVSIAVFIVVLLVVVLGFFYLFPSSYSKRTIVLKEELPFDCIALVGDNGADSEPVNSVDFALAQMCRVMGLGYERRKEYWQENLKAEVEYWEGAIPKHWNNRDDLPIFDPNLQFGPRNQNLHRHIKLELIEDFRIKVLEVGASWTSKLGKVFPDDRYEISVLPCDPLSMEYERILKQHSVKVPVSTIFCKGEQLSKFFAPNSFDMVHYRNALDHSIHPVLALNEALRVVKHGQVVYTLHAENEGKLAKYESLHQWNFFIDDFTGHAIFADKWEYSYDVNYLFQGVAEVNARRIPAKECATGKWEKGDLDCIEIILRKLQVS